MIVSVNFPTDEGFWGRECESCNKYFKIHIDDMKEKNFCTYCGEEFEGEELRTKKQQKEIQRVAEQVVVSEFQKMMASVFRPKKTKNIEYKPGKRVKVTPPKNHLEEKVDSEIHCDCGTRFHVYGIFGYCPGCQDENIMIYEENLKIVLKEIENTNNKQRQLRHAYDDLVSTFEYFGKQYGDKLGAAKNTNYQNLTNTRKALKKFQIDIYEGLKPDEKLTIKKVFLKKHAFQHHRGKITEEYIRAFPQEKLTLTDNLELNDQEFKDAVTVLRKMIDQIVKTA